MYPVSAESSGSDQVNVPNGNISNKARTLLCPFLKLMLMLQTSQKGGEEKDWPYFRMFPHNI